MWKSSFIRFILWLSMALFVIVSCNGNAQEPVEEFTPVEAFPNLGFDLPVFLTHSGDGSNRIFVVELDGIIRVFPNSASASQTTTFLNIGARVSSGGEMGLLGLAFHPNYANNGLFYVNYTSEINGPRRTVIARFNVGATNPNQADPNSELILLEFNQPYSNHNGGMMQFGPDGYLYIATGDGGSGGDPQNNAQNRSSFLGKILRIDVDSPSEARNYGIPPDNPFADNTQNFREEIFAYGLRNPWRFSIDFASGQIWCGDVGQGAREEVDLIEKGNNYGWRIMEGTLCYDNPGQNCDRTGLTLPVLDYGRDRGRSITGGYIYRGSIKPSLVGAYIYGDYETHRIWMLRYENGQVSQNQELVTADFGISSFGVDESNELYIVGYSLSGASGIYRFPDNPTAVNDKPENPERFVLEPNHPNPFNPLTRIRYRVPGFDDVQLAVFNALGRKIRTLISQQQGPGEFQVVWDGRDDGGEIVASGVYLYQLKIGDEQHVRKMTLIR